jgi:hypothetical protein
MRWRPGLLEAAIVLALLAHSAVFVWRCPGTLAPAGELGLLEELRAAPWTHRLSPWVADYLRYYPPLYQGWLALCPWPGGQLSPALLALWGDLPLAAGFLALAAGLRRLTGGRTAPVACLLLLGGFPLANIFLKNPSYEGGLMAAVCALLGLLWGLSPAPGRGQAVALGLLAGAGLLCKWTLPLYVAGPAAVVFLPRLCRRGEFAGTARWLGLAAATAAVLAAPWYLLCLDRARLLATAANDVTFPGTAGWEAYRQGLICCLTNLRFSVGPSLIPFLAAGWALALWKRPGFAGGAALSVLFPLAILPAFPHQEPRYLLALLPALASGAAAGLAALPWTAGRRAALLGLAAAAAYQSVDFTWGHLREPCLPVQSGPLTATDSRLRMYAFDLNVTEWFQLQRLRWSVELFADERPGTFGVHPLEALGTAKSEMFGYLDRVAPTPGLRADLCGYNWSEYRRFLEDLDAGRPDLLLVSGKTLEVDLEQGRYWAGNAWGYVAQAGPNLAAGGGGPPADPFVLDRIDRDYGILETVSTRCGPVYLLVRRELWRRAGRGAPLPGLHRPPRQAR